MIFVFLGRKGLLYNSVGRGFAIAMCTGALGMLLNVLGAILYYPTLPQEKLSDMVMMVAGPGLDDGGLAAEQA